MFSVYTFRSKCEEEAECILEDRATRIFLNTRGENDSERIKRIHQRVCEVRLSEEAGVKHMQAWEEKYYEKEKIFRKRHSCSVTRAEGQQADPVCQNQILWKGDPQGMHQ